MIKYFKLIYLSSFVFFLLLGCGAANTSDFSSNSSDSQDAYPIPSGNFYPAPGVQADNLTGYPAIQVKDESKQFKFNRPLAPGMETISGTGPVNVPIKIISVSNTGELLGTVTIEENKTFEVQLHRPLNSNEAIAIMLADDAMRSQFLDAPGATDIPLLGFVLDMATTAQP